MSLNDERLEVIKRIRIERLMTLVRRHRIPSEDASDLVQDTLLTLYYHPGELPDPEGSAITTLNRKCTLYLRKHRQGVAAAVEGDASLDSTPEEFELERAVSHRSHQRPREILEFVTLLVPRRIAEEEIGGALEQIHYLSSLGRPRWQLWLKVVTTLFWVCLNSLREITSAVRGRASAKP